LDRDRVRRIARVLGQQRAAGREIVLVSSGAVAAGLEPMGITRRPKDQATKQAAAGVGQSLLMAEYTHTLAEHGIVPAQVLLTADDLIHRAKYRNAQRAVERMLALGIFPIVNENDAVVSHGVRFGDNDRLSALVAHLIHAEALVLLSDVDSLLTAPPGAPGSRRVPFIGGPAHLDELRIGGTGAAGTGTGGMVTKVQAATMAADSGIATILTSADHIAEAVAGGEVGTAFGVTHRRRATRLLWIAHLAQKHGTIHVDAGAARAVSERGRSLLAVGVVGADGGFDAGDPVDVRGPDGALVARGIANFAEDELPAMMGRSSEELGNALGSDYRREVIHRNDMVLTDAVFEQGEQ
jgi:glutamate 5-kinase